MTRASEREIHRAVRPGYVPTPYQDGTESGRLILRDGSTPEVLRWTDNALLDDLSVLGLATETG